MSESTTKHKGHIYDARYMTREISVSGLVNNPLTLHIDDLRKMDAIEVKNLTIICRSGSQKEKVSSYRGVLLRNILDMADVIIKEHHAPNWIYLALFSSEGYWAIFSWHEIYNSSVGEQAIVLIEKNGLPLDEREGEIAFISANDYRPGPRRLRYLQRIEVNELTLDNR